MKKVKQIVMMLLASLLAQSVWAAVGDAATISNLETQFTKVDGATNVNINSLTIPETDDLPLGSVVTIQSIGVTYRNTNYASKLTLDGHDSISKDAAVSLTLKGNQGNKTANLVRYNFDNVEVVVGKTVPITNAGNYSIYLPLPKSGNTALGQSNYANYGLAYEIKYTVKTIAGAAVNYTCTVEGETATWNTTPADIKVSDTFTFTGNGTVELPAGAANSIISIGQGVTLVVKESGLTKSRVTNNGTIRVVGGTDADPIVITEDGAANTSIGTIKVAADSVLKIHATGGNKVYTVTGENQDTSKVILTSGQNWGMSDNTAIRNCSLSIQGTSDFWFERAAALDATVNLDIASGRTLHLGNPGTVFTIGALTGAGTFSKDNASDHLKLNIGSGKTCAFSGNLAGIPVTIVSGTLMPGKDNAFGTSTITIEEGAMFHLNGYVNDGGCTIVSNGGQITSDRQHRYANENSIGSLTLYADTSMVGGTRFGLTKADGSETSLALNGHTLNVNLGVSNQTFNFRNTTVTGEGTIAIGANTYALVYDNGTGSMIAEDAKVTMTASSKLELNTQGTLTVKDFTAATGATIIGGNDNQGTLKVLGTCSGTFSVPKLELATGARVVGTPTVTQALTLGSTIKMAEGASIHVAGTATVPETLPLVLDDNGVVVGTLVANEGVLTVSPVVDLSKLVALGGTSVALADGVSLNLDTAVEGDALAITSTGTVQVYKPSNSWVVNGSAAVLSEHNITIDANKVTYWFENSLDQKAESYFGHEAAYWTNVYGGPTTVSSVGNTPVLEQWRELGGDKTLPQYNSNSSNYEPILLDGKLMPYISVSEGYKQLRSDYYEGWNLRMALVNNVCLEMQALAKFQGNGDMFVGVDATSKLIIDTYNNGNNNEHKIVFDIASAEGLTVNSSMLAEGNQNYGMFEYNFRGNGSIKVGGEFNLGASHAIKHVDIELSSIEGTKFKDIISKKLIGFASHGADMSINWADDATISAGCTISTTPVTPLSDIGTASIAFKDDGVYVEYVDYVAAHPPTYRWEHIGSSSWGAEGAWKGLLDLSVPPTARTWDEANAKTETIVDDVVDGKFYINMAKPFYFYFDTAKSTSVVVDKTVHASQTGYNPETGANGTGNRYVIVSGTGAFSFNLPGDLANVDSQGAPLSTFDFSTYDVEMAAPVDATTFNGELGLRAKLTGPITLGPQTKIVFIAPEGEETIAYDYKLVNCEGSVEVRGAGTFIVPNTMTGVPFEKTEGGFLKYNIASGTVTAAAISGNGGVIKTGAGTLKITEAASFTGDLVINGGAVEVIAPPQDSEHAAIQVTVSEGAEMRLVLSDLTQDYTAANVSGKVVFVTEDGRVLRSEGNTYKGTSTPGICSVGENEYHYIDEAITATGSNGTVTLLAACAQDANIPVGVTLNTNGKAFTGKVTGAGTIIFDTTTPESAALTDNAFTADGWTGTVWLKNIGAAAFNANQPLVPVGDLIKLGNANSTLKLTDCRGYINDANGVNYPYTLELENGTGLNDNRPYAWTNVSGYTGRSHKFKALTGSGTLIATGNCHEDEKFGTVEDFSGKLILDWGKRITVGDTTTTPANGGIVFANGAKFNHTITVDAKGGISFGNTIVLGEEIASVGSTVIAGLPQPASIPAIDGDNMLVYEGTSLKVAKTVAKIGDVKYATIDSAIDAMASGAASEVTLVDETITELPAGYEAYKITDGKIVAKSVYAITVTGDHVASTTIPASVREDQNEISFMITPETDYVIKSVTANGEAIEAVDGVYSCTISAATTITITAELDVVMIDIPEVENMVATIVDGEGNKIELEAGTITVTIGTTFTVTYTPVAGYVGSTITTTYKNASASTEVVAPTEAPAAAVAKIGTTLVSAADFRTKVNAIADEETVQLLANIDLGTTYVTIKAGAAVTLDLNGKTITSSGSYAVSLTGSLTVKDSATGGKIVNTNSKGKTIYGSNGTLALESGTIEATAAAVVGGTVNISGGTVTAGTGIAVSGSGTISGGTLTSTSSYAAYANQSGKALVITDGTLKGAAVKGDVGIYTGNVKVTGIEGVKIAFASNASGLVLADTDVALIPDVADVAVYDGETLEGYYFSASSNGLYTGCKGKTCKLVKDIDHQIAIGVNTTLDLNGHNITVTDAISAILVKSGTATAIRTVTITGEGTVSCDNGSGCNAVQVQRYADVTIAGGSYYVGADTASSDPDNATIYIVDSYKTAPTKVTITGGTFEAAGSGNFTLNIKDDLRTGLTAEEVPTITVKGGTFKNGFDPMNNQAEGPGTDFVDQEFASVAGSTEGTFTIARAVAQVEGGLRYATLEAAMTASKSGDTIKLLADVENIGAVTLEDGVTFDGDGKKITGASALYCDPTSTTVIKNVVFENIHNDSPISEINRELYGFPEGAKGTQSAIYASGFSTGSITITGCTFDNCDWDAIQIVPADGATGAVEITNNVFKHSDTTKHQLRYIHIQHMKSTDVHAVPVVMTITDNQFFDVDKSTLSNIESISIDSVKLMPQTQLSGNYYSDSSTIHISDISLQNYYPMRSQPTVDEDDVLFPLFSIGSATYGTLVEAVAAANAGTANVTINLNGDLTVDETVEICNANAKTITFNGNGHFIIANTTIFRVATQLNFAACSVSSTPSGLVTCPANDPLFVVVGGTLNVNSGIYTKDISSLVNARTYYLDQNEDNNYVVKSLNDATAVAKGYVARQSSMQNMSPYYKTLSELVSDKKVNAYLFTDVNEDLQITTGKAINLYSADASNPKTFTGSITQNGAFNVSIYGCNATLESVVCEKLSVGYSTDKYGVSTVTVKGGTVNALNVNATYGKLIIQGGTFGVDPTEYLADGYEAVKTGDVWVVGKICVAQIGTTKYETLAAAVAAATVGQTVTLIADVAFGEYDSVSALTIAGDRDFTLDLAGHTISGTATRKATSQLILVEVGAKVKIVDSSEGETGKITYVGQADPSWGYGTSTILNHGTLTIESGMVENATVNGASYAIDNVNNNWGTDAGKHAMLTISGGKVKCDNGAQAVRNLSNSGENVSKAIFNMTGGEIVSGGFWGNIIANKANTAYVDEAYEINISGGKINGMIDLISNGSNAKVNITGGEFNTSTLRLRKPTVTSLTVTTPYVNISGGKWKIDTLQDQTTNQIHLNVTGGVFSSEILKDFVADGYAIVDNDDPVYTKTVGLKVQDLTITIDGDKTTPIKVADSWIAENVKEGATAAEIKEKLEAVEVNGLKGWQNYVMGVNGSVATNVLKPVQGEATAAEKSGKTEPVVITVPFTPVNVPSAQNSKIEVVYQLLKGTMGTDGKIQWAAEPVAEGAAPRFVLDFMDTGDTYWKIQAVFKSVM